MPPEANPVVSAQVVLRSASGKAPSSDTPITSANLGEFQPLPQTASRVQQTLATSGFEIGPLVGNSFSIAAPVDVFEKTFHTKLRREGKNAALRITAAESGGYELPLASLPKSIAKDIAAVTFTPPPDFGPTRFGP